MDAEVIAENTPEMTQEFIHADDPDWVPEGTEEADTEDAESTDTEVTEEPADEEAAEEETAEGTEEEAAEEEIAEVTVTIITTMTGENEMKLSAVVNDPEGRTYAFQWQESEDGGETYADMEDATASELDVLLTDENIEHLWRVRVQAIG